MKRITLDEEIMYRAFMSRDREFTGVFFTASRPPEYSAIPECSARKPKRKNVVFFGTAAEALRAGFRPCKLCRPLDPPYEAPEGISRLLKDLESEPERRIRDGELRTRGFDPSTVRRWFKTPRDDFSDVSAARTFESCDKALK